MALCVFDQVDFEDEKRSVGHVDIGASRNIVCNLTPYLTA